MGTGYDNGGPDMEPTEIHTDHKFCFETLVQYIPNLCPDDRGLGTVKVFCISIRSVAAVYCELCITK